METIITKASALKKIKDLGIYEKKHFSMKMVDLRQIIQDKLDLDSPPPPPKKVLIEEPVFENEEVKDEYEKLTKHQKTKVKKEKIVKELLAKPLYEYNKPVIIVEDNYTGKPPSKHQLKIQMQKKLEEQKLEEIKLVPKEKGYKLQKIIKPKIDYKKAIQSVIKKLNDDIIELLHDFDTEKLSDTDKTIIDVEYQKILDSAYSVLEKELEEVEDENYIKLIERKIKIIDDRVQLFLED
jgi:exonuclease VII large subunit